MIALLWAAMVLTIGTLGGLGSAVSRRDRRGATTMLLAVVVGMVLTAAIARALVATW
ncbi:hypothetical protein [Microbacterium sp. Bi128]|uniref:hypothetical protein n=1 Tax=Microbacterium sp. Bi128 TaxID=2821115 RepID=UPI001D4E575D|nr:hypothetical protein [Microbacterium sp. Bi128]CAH0253802.1 hypothetical protein SRABI128_02975 [Microbacterium sp. Bi128]